MPRRLRVRFLPSSALQAAGGSFSIAGSASQGVKSSTPVSDFDTRKVAPGVIRWFDFDTIEQLGPRAISNPGYSYLDNYGITPGELANGTQVWPTLDYNVKRSGAASLHLVYNSPSSANPGAWFCNFSPDLSMQFGENSEFYVQVAVRWNDAMIDTLFTDPQGDPQVGIKFFDCAGQDQVGGYNPQSDGITHFYSSSDIKTVVSTWMQRRFPSMYRYMPSGDTGVSDEGLWSRPPGEINFECAMPAPFCLYSTASGIASPTAPVPGCFNIVANTWYTLQLGITTGPIVNMTWGGTTQYRMFSNSTVKLWITPEGGATTMLIDWNPSTPGYTPLWAGPAQSNEHFGKVWLFPYMTNLNTTQIFPRAEVWYDEVIISTQRIPDPATSGGGGPPPPVTLPNLPPNTMMDLGRYACSTPMSGVPTNCDMITDYSGMVYDPVRYQMCCFGGGHASTNYDAVNTFRMDRLAWVEEYSPTPDSQMLIANYDYSLGAWLHGPSGPYPRAAARHTTDQMTVVGDDLILLSSVEGNGSGPPEDSNPYTSLLFKSDARISHYNFVSKTWSFTSINGEQEWGTCAYDPVANKVMMLSNHYLQVYDQVTKTKAIVFDLSTYAGLDHLVDESGNKVANELDINNNMVYFPPTDRFYYITRAGKVYEVRPNRLDITQTMIVLLATTGPLPPSSETGFAYDSHNNIIGGAVTNNVFYVFNPATKVWTSSVMLGGAPGSMAFHAIDYDPVNNAFIFLTDGTSGRRTCAYRWA